MGVAFDFIFFLLEFLLENKKGFFLVLLKKQNLKVEKPGFKKQKKAF